MPKPIQVGRKERMSFAKINEVGQMPNLIDIQTKSYDWFINEGLREVFEDISPIRDYAGNLILEFIDYSLNDPPKYEQEECKERDVTYAAPLKVKVRLVNKETGEVKEQEVFMGDFPLMTEKGTFIYNGAERVIVTQLVRSPGPYFDVETDKSNQKLYSSQIIPNRGAWIEYETDSNEILSVRVDRTRKQPLTTLLRALGMSSNEEILNTFGPDPRLMKTLEKDTTNDYESGLKEIYKKLRPGEPPTVDSAKSLLNSLFFDAKRYDLSHVGRYKYNKKLGLSNRLINVIASEDVIDPNTGEILVEKGQKIDRTMGKTIENAGVEYVMVYGRDDESVETKVIGSQFVEIAGYVDFDVTELKINDKVYYPVLKEILDQNLSEDELKKVLVERKNDLSPKHVIMADIVASVSYILNLPYGIGDTDDIDHLGNRRLRTVGELLQNQFRIGLARMERVVKERMTIQDIEVTTPQALMNIRPVTAAIKEFFGSSQLSQFMDQNNPLAELTHKRRLSALGPGGLSRERAGFEVRDIHQSHYGRMCPIETPEGPNIGLIGSLTIYGIINQYGFIETPYRVVDKESGVVTDEIRYVAADEEELMIIAQANEPLDEQGHFVNEKVAARGVGGEIALFPREQTDMMDVSPKQVVSVATAMIPFLENDDANRALMGSNMQRQAVPLLVTEAPLVATGMEKAVARDSRACITARRGGEVVYSSGEMVSIRPENGSEPDIYELIKYRRSNNTTCVTQHPLVLSGQKIKKGDVIADGPATDNGQLALGKNMLVAFMSWEGFNYEDAILVSEKLVEEDALTSIFIEEFEVEARDTKLGPEEITRDIPNVGTDALENIDSDGIVVPSTMVHPGDILVCKVSPKGEQQLSPEERLLKVIFGKKAEDVTDTSLRVPPGTNGKVIGTRVFVRREKLSKQEEDKRKKELDADMQRDLEALKAFREQTKKDGKNSEGFCRQMETRIKEKCAREKEMLRNSGELPVTVNKSVKVYIALKRRLQVGDKLSGRHGNKGVVARILPREDMPYMPDGTPMDIVLSPLGVPSRMNIGQILETMLGWAAKQLDTQMICPVFDSAAEDNKNYWKYWETKHGKKRGQITIDDILKDMEKPAAEKPGVIQMIQLAKDTLRAKGVPEEYLPDDYCRITLYDGRTGEPFPEKITIG